MKKTVAFIVTTMILVFITTFSVTEVVQSQTNEDLKIAETYYQELEASYKESIQEILAEAGFRNSGVMITRTVFEDGSREYEIAVHHNRFDRLDEEERKELTQTLSLHAPEGLLEEGFTLRYSLTGNA